VGLLDRVPSPRPIARLVVAASVALCVAAAGHAAGPPGSNAPGPKAPVEPTPDLTLEHALALARANNASLPVAALDTRIAEQNRVEAASLRKIRLGVEGSLSVAPRGGYDPAASNLGEDRLQAVLERPLYDGGRLAAEERRAGALAEVARQRYRRAEAVVELDVRTRYAELLAARREAAVRQDGLKRLRSYLELLESRGASGQPVESDLLRGRLRVATEDAARQTALEHADRARAELDTLMGRAPETPLTLAPLPSPAPPAGPASTPKEGAETTAHDGPPDGATETRATDPQVPDDRIPVVRIPDVTAALRAVDAARAGLDATLAERRPTLSLRADAGLWGTDTTRLVPPDLRASDPGAGFLDRLDRDLGYSVSLDLTWSLFDSGGRRARIARSQLELDRAKQQVVVEQTDARRELTRARDARARASARLQILREARPQARDAYLDATSRYLGGAASYLDVVDAFDASISVGVEEAQATLDYRIAEAEMIRWGGTP